MLGGFVGVAVDAFHIVAAEVAYAGQRGNAEQAGQVAQQLAGLDIKAGAFFGIAT